MHANGSISHNHDKKKKPGDACARASNGDICAVVKDGVRVIWRVNFKLIIANITDAQHSPRRLNVWHVNEEREIGLRHLEGAVGWVRSQRGSALLPLFKINDIVKIG